MDRPRRESRQHNGITLRGLSQPTFATKSAPLRHAEPYDECRLSGVKRSNADIAKSSLLPLNGPRAARVQVQKSRHSKQRPSPKIGREIQRKAGVDAKKTRSEEHRSELQSLRHLVC